MSLPLNRQFHQPGLGVLTRPAGVRQVLPDEPSLTPTKEASLQAESQASRAIALVADLAQAQLALAADRLSPSVNTQLGVVYYFARRHDELIKRVSAGRDFADFAVDPMMDPLRSDPRFTDMMSQLKLPAPSTD